MIFKTVINNKDIIKEMTDWNAQEPDRQSGLRQVALV